MNDYINDFISYMLHASIASKRHQINLFITGLQGPLQSEVAQHHPRRWRQPYPWLKPRGITQPQ
jgi:hypothetical protein